MLADYKPIMSVPESRKKLARLTRKVESSPQELAEGILDVLASRGGERWRRLDEIQLKTGIRNRFAVIVGYEPDYKGFETAFMSVYGPGDRNQYHYGVRQSNSDTVTLEEMIIREGTTEFVPVINYGGLAPARLLSILEKAHRSTPNRPIAKGFYKPD